jgi:oxygen-independent coproporphyrinogen-3 oxidase
LIVEIKEMGKLISETGLKVNTIYIGGGTPSILSNEEIDEMLKCVNENIDMKNIKEFTFEAGRIDTINKEKLETMKKWNIDRISINPQSFNERTLKLVNRYHKREKFDEVFEDAKQLGFIINMDLIIGLPEESTKDVLHTLNELNKYDIENLTIHNLAIKKASKLQKESYEHENNLDYKVIHEKIENVVNAKDLNAYYMYRQKNSFVWGENVGYSKIGLESIYNIEMIEENKTIIGIGAGSMTKVVFEKENRTIIERLVNPKDPLVWIDELQKRMEEKKKRIMEVYK